MMLPKGEEKFMDVLRGLPVETRLRIAEISQGYPQFFACLEELFIKKVNATRRGGQRMEDIFSEEKGKLQGTIHDLKRQYEGA